MTQEKSREEEKELELEMKIYEQRVKKTNEAVHFLAQFGIGFIWRVVTVLVEEKDIANQRVFPGLAQAVGQCQIHGLDQYAVPLVWLYVRFGISIVEIRHGLQYEPEWTIESIEEVELMDVFERLYSFCNVVITKQQYNAAMTCFLFQMILTADPGNLVAYMNMLYYVDGLRIALGLTSLTRVFIDDSNTKAMSFCKWLFLYLQSMTLVNQFLRNKKLWKDDVDNFHSYKNFGQMYGD